MNLGSLCFRFGVIFVLLLANEGGSGSLWGHFWGHLGVTLGLLLACEGGFGSFCGHFAIAWGSLCDYFGVT